MKTTTTYLFFLGCLCLAQVSCRKYLGAKPDQSITTPSTIGDLEGILDNYNFVNARYPSASEVSADSYYLVQTDWNSLNDRQRNFYTWQKSDDIGADYTSSYSAIEYANIILDALPNISGGSPQERNGIEGNALFIRASYHYALAQLFAKGYDKATAGSDLGIALRLTSDIAVKPVRSNLAATYGSVITDLQQSVPLLPADPGVKYKAGKAAAYGMLARVYLSMSDYKNAGLYADSALHLYSTLIDYNTVNAKAAIPFPQFNDEVIYDSRAPAPQALSAAKARIDTVLYASFAASDLRKTIFFKANANGSHGFKGNYTGLNNASLFTGIATDELYLVKAEAAARNGDVSGALQSLNALLVTRWKTGTYAPYTVTDASQLLGLILRERRKELLFRGLRWTDLRRLNKDASYSAVLLRNLNGTAYTLEPGSPRYVFEIDQNAVSISGLVQNP
ncbi:MAG: RagB/SusD family nutrient uptake outer membrane protein [Sphingobacteriales bacterium]